MIKNKLTPLGVKNLKPSSKDQLISDGDSLFLSIRSVGNGGAKSFRMAYRINGKQSWLTLEKNTLADARAERDENKALVTKGLDPALERKLNVIRTHNAQLEEQEAEKKLNARMTVNDLFVRWCSIDLTKRKGMDEITRTFNKDILPELGLLFVEDVTKSHISLIIGKMKIRGAPHTARNLIILVRQMFRFAVSHDLIDADPTARIDITKMTTKASERDRVLSESEIKALARQMPDANLNPATECAIWISIATACRVGEISKAKHTDVDFDAGTWVIPKENSKNGKAHTIVLSNFALEQFRRLTRLSTSAVWLLPHRDNIRSASRSSLAQQLNIRQIPDDARCKDNQSLMLVGGKWTPHDLRRTGATIMGGLGVAPDTIDKCLNHVEPNKIKRTYQRQKLEAEQAQAWKLLGERLELLVNLDAVNVIPLHKAS
jgi:integrase